MKKENYLSAGKAVLFLMLATLLGSCTDSMDEGIGKPLPEGKYPVEFTSATYGLEVDTRAVTENSTWTGNELVAVQFGTQEVKKYTAAASGGNLTAASGTAPFYWKSTSESQTVTAWHKPSGYTSTKPTTFTVQTNQNSATGYIYSDLIMACNTVKFTDSQKKLTFKHLPAKVTINLTGNDAVPDLTGAVVTLMNVNLTSGAITAQPLNITVAQAGAGTGTITPKQVSLSADKKTLTVQALLPPQDVSGKQFVKVELNSNTYYYTPQNEDGKFETGKGYTYNITVQGKELVDQMSFTIDLTNYDKTFIIPFPKTGTTGNYTLTIDWGDNNKTTVNPSTNLSTPIQHTYAENKQYTITITTTQTDATQAQMPDFIPGNNYDVTNNNSKKLILMNTPMLNTGQTSFEYCFYECTNLTTIPADVFDKNSQVTDFTSCFYRAGLIEIPAGLFDKHTEAKIFEACFQECPELTTIPDRLFANNKKVTTFQGCFLKSPKIKIHPNIFCNEADGEGLTRFIEVSSINFSQCFGSLAGGSSTEPGTAPELWDASKYTLPTKVSLAYCFSASNLTNWNSIPKAWGGPL